MSYHIYNFKFINNKPIYLKILVSTITDLKLLRQRKDYNSNRSLDN